MKKPKKQLTATQTPAWIAQEKIKNLRMMIDQLDDMMIQTVVQRMTVSRTIGKIKKQHAMKVKDAKREKDLQKFHRNLAKKYGITYPTLQKIFALVMQESKRIQK